MTHAGKPDWWRANEAAKAAFDLPAYDPPRFADGTYTHEVVPALESRFGCTICFLGIDPRYPEDWEVRIDGETAFSIERRRDDHGNTVYGIAAPAFERRVRTELGK